MDSYEFMNHADSRGNYCHPLAFLLHLEILTDDANENLAFKDWQECRYDVNGLCMICNDDEMSFQ